MVECFACRTNIHKECTGDDCTCKECNWGLDDKHLQLGDHTK